MENTATTNIEDALLEGRAWIQKEGIGPSARFGQDLLVIPSLDDAFRSPAGQIYRKDCPSGLKRRQQDQVMARFSEIERHSIGKRVLLNTLEPEDRYWDKAANECFPAIFGARDSQGRSLWEAQRFGHLLAARLSGAISKRQRDRSTVTGDVDSIRAFAGVLFSSQVRLDASSRHTLAAHFFTQARFQKRHERSFEKICPLLPEECTEICDTVRQGCLQPEIMAGISYLRTLSDKQLAEHVSGARADVIDLARMNAPKDEKGREHLTRVAALARSIRRSESAGIFSRQALRSDREIFRSGHLTGGSELMMLGASVVMAERELDTRDRVAGSQR